MQEGGDEKKGGFFSIRGEEGRGEEKMCGLKEWKVEGVGKKKENAEALQHANLPRWYHCSFLLNLELYIGE